MNQVEELCDRVLMINQGSAVLYGDLKATKASFSKKSVQVAIEGDLGDLPGVIEKKFDNGSYELVLAPDTKPQTILDRLRKQGTAINRFEITTPSLHEIFLNIVRENHE